MKSRRTTKYFGLLILFVIGFNCCNRSKQEAQGASQDTVIKNIKPNSPEDEKKIQKSKDMMLEIYKQLNFIPDMEDFINVLNHCKNNHLFVNADNQSYIIVAVSNKGFKQIPEPDQKRLIDTSGNNNAYKLKFFINHIISTPRKVNPGMVFRTLAGQDVFIADNRSDLRLSDKTYRIQSSLKFSDNLEIIAIDSVLYR
jgi:hypothetical protein